MKAYKAWDAKSIDEYSTVVFAETAQKAKIIAMTTEACEDAEYIDIRVHRFPEMDGRYHGKSEIDWCDMEDRKALVALGWMCFDLSEECDTCPCKPDCGRWEEEDNDA